MPKTTLADGSPVTADYAEINPSTGMQKDYLVLGKEEREKGYVRPVRRSYIHVGPPPPRYPLRDLTELEKKTYEGCGYVKFEEYPESKSPVVGRFWTQAQLDNKGCGYLTTMAQSIAETYARDPKFYGATYCVSCKTHLPVGEYGEFVWADAQSERVGT